MGDLLYVYGDQVYVNLTNRCSADCVFCIRNKKEGVGHHTLVLEQDSSLEELKDLIDRFDFSDYRQLVFCGYGEPTCALEQLIGLAEYWKQRHQKTVRVNTNGLGNLYHGRNIVPELCRVVDCFSISMNAPTADQYEKIVRPKYPNGFETMLTFAKDVKAAGKKVQFTIVDVLSEKDTDACQKLADACGIPLRIRAYEA